MLRSASDCKDSGKQFSERCGGTTDPMLDFLIKVCCQKQMATKIKKVLNILQSSPLIVMEGGLEGVLGIGWCSTLNTILDHVVVSDVIGLTGQC